MVSLKLIISSAYTHPAKKKNRADSLRETMKKRPSTPRPPNLMIKYLTSAMPSAFKSVIFRSFSDNHWKLKSCERSTRRQETETRVKA